MKHLRSISELGVDGVHRLLELTDHMAEVNARPNPRVPALRGRTVCNLFFEDSTRTRLSFETAAKRLSADVMTFTVGSSSVNKGESLRDTIETVAAMGVDAFVIRHRVERGAVAGRRAGRPPASSTAATAGTPTRRRRCSTPTRCAAALARTGGLDGLRIGDRRRHQALRVARSTAEVFAAARRRRHARRPRHAAAAGDRRCPTTADLDAVVGKVDVLYLLRMQRERMHDAARALHARVQRRASG